MNTAADRRRARCHREQGREERPAAKGRLGSSSRRSREGQHCGGLIGITGFVAHGIIRPIAGIDVAIDAALALPDDGPFIVECLLGVGHGGRVEARDPV